MIIIFTITDSRGLCHRCSAVCGPSTTAVGAINQLRNKLSIPTDVEVEVHLANDVPIRHLTAPLTSLRKQRSGSAQVLRIQLWARLSGPEASVAEINYSAAEAVDPAKAAEEEEDDDSVAMMSSSTMSDRNNNSGSVSYSGHSARIIVAAPTTRAPPKPVQAKAPATSQEPSRKPSPAAAPVAQPRSASAEDSAAAASSTSALVIKRRETKASSGGDMPAMPLTARGPARRPPVEVERGELQMPQSARGVAPARGLTGGPAERGGRYVEVAGGNGGAMYKTGVARRDAALAHIMLREYPKIVPRDPKAIVEAVKDNSRLASLSYSAAFAAASDVDGVDDRTYARCLSVAYTHGQELRSAAHGAGPRLALYGELSSIRHSCCPNAAVQYDLFSAPFAGSCRCAALSGIQQGQAITYLYKHADSLAFLLLSRDRRRNILQRKYFIECDCPRCTETSLEDEVAAPIVKKKGSRTGTAKALAHKIGTRTKAQREAEATLTGAFFTDSSVDRDPVKQRELMEEMRKDFDALQIVDDTGVEITLSLVGNVPPLQRTKQCNRLLSFLRKYGTADSVLRLHDHHWRMNLARAAYVQETVRLCAVKGATPEARQRDPQSKTLFTPTKTVYDMCLKQLAVEALFVPPGHPHSLTTYESFLYLVAILPASIAQSITRTAQNNESIKWKQLEQTKQAWGVLKRAALPPPVRQLVQRKETSGTTTPTAQSAASQGTRSNTVSPTPTVKLPPRRMQEASAEAAKK